MEYRIAFDCPDQKKVIERLLKAASGAGAGSFGNYDGCALVTRGYGTWRSQAGARPYIGRIGKVSKVKSVRIEMSCPKGKVKEVLWAIKNAHPYEEPVIYSFRVKYA